MSVSPDARTRWSDERLDDFYQEFRRSIPMVEKVAVLEEALHNVAEDALACRKNIHTLRTELANTSLALRNDLADSSRTQIAERKSDRRWLIGTCLSTAGLIVAALAVLLGHVG